MYSHLWDNAVAGSLSCVRNTANLIVSQTVSICHQAQLILIGNVVTAGCRNLGQAMTAVADIVGPGQVICQTLYGHALVKRIIYSQILLVSGKRMIVVLEQLGM